MLGGGSEYIYHPVFPPPTATGVHHAKIKLSAAQMKFPSHGAAHKSLKSTNVFDGWPQPLTGLGPLLSAAGFRDWPMEQREKNH